jgi:hypothetical protein
MKRSEVLEKLTLFFLSQNITLSAEKMLDFIENELHMRPPLIYDMPWADEWMDEE